jgi:hypothetical protein
LVWFDSLITTSHGDYRRAKAGIEGGCFRVPELGVAAHIRESRFTGGAKSGHDQTNVEIEPV